MTLELGILLALACAFATNLGFLYKYRGAKAAATVDMRHPLRSAGSLFGSKWFATREAGSLLRELWGEGQRMRAEEMLKDVTGSTLEMEAVAERVREVLR